MKKTVKVREVTFGEGAPAICVPIMGRMREEIRNEAHAFEAHRADVAEWRADAYLAARTWETGEKVSEIPLIPVLQMLRRELHSTPLVFTIRTKAEGGLIELSDEAYIDYVRDALYSGCVDLIDLEWRLGEKVCQKIITEARSEDVKVVISSHDFQKTPDTETMVERLTEMERFGADLPKIAVMPQSIEDVLQLCSATAQASKKLTQPIITMAMGDLGKLTRLTGEAFGSAMTFAAAGEASAPGQMDVSSVREVLKLLHHKG